MSTSDGETHFGLTGLATMGANLARNVAHHGIPVAVHNRTTSRMQKFLEEHGSEGPISGYESTEEWVQALARPRVLMSMVQAGAATDAVIDDIAPHLDAGDILIDGGNAYFRDTQRRHAKLAEQGDPLPRRRRLRRRGGRAERAEHHARRRPRALRRQRQADLRDDRRHVDGTPCCTYVSAPTAPGTS